MGFYARLFCPCQSKVMAVAEITASFRLISQDASILAIATALSDYLQRLVPVKKVFCDGFAVYHISYSICDTAQSTQFSRNGVAVRLFRTFFFRSRRLFTISVLLIIALKKYCIRSHTADGLHNTDDSGCISIRSATFHHLATLRCTG